VDEPEGWWERKKRWEKGEGTNTKKSKMKMKQG
jgi:hypothetical protein